jgi:hypothetical protein
MICGKKRTDLEKRYNDLLCKKCRMKIEKENRDLNHPYGIGL